MCSKKNKALADSNGMEFNDAVKHIEEILQHSIVVGHDIYQDLDIFPIPSSAIRAVYDTAECRALQERAGLPINPGEKPSLKSLAKALLGKDIQKGKYHDPCEDAYASLQLFLQNRQLFEEALRKPKGKAPLDIDTDSSKSSESEIGALFTTDSDEPEY